MEGLAEKISKELDGVFYGIRFMENEILSEEELISRFLEKEKDPAHAQGWGDLEDCF